MKCWAMLQYYTYVYLKKVNILNQDKEGPAMAKLFQGKLSAVLDAFRSLKILRNCLTPRSVSLRSVWLCPVLASFECSKIKIFDSAQC